MRKNQKLGLVAVAFLTAGFGANYYFNKDAETHAAPVGPNYEAAKERTERNMAKYTGLEASMPSPVEKAIEQRWPHLNENILTTAAVEGDGSLIFYDRKLKVGLNGDGEKIYAQGMHRSFKMLGPVMRDFPREPQRLTPTNKAKAGDGYFLKALQTAEFQDPANQPDAPRVPTGQ